MSEPTGPRMGVRGEDVHVRIDGSMPEVLEQRLQRELAYATKARTHLWTAVLQHKVDPVKVLAGEGSFDLESMIGTPQLGCYVCEAAFDPRLLHRRCPGEPTGSTS